MKRLMIRYAVLGFLTAGLGLISAVWGGTTFLRFLDGPMAEGRPTLGQIARGVLLPHFCALVGIGLIVYGMILLVKTLIFFRQYRYKRSRSTCV